MNLYTPLPDGQIHITTEHDQLLNKLDEIIQALERIAGALERAEPA
jgi:hypothetical protein